MVETRRSSSSSKRPLPSLSSLPLPNGKRSKAAKASSSTNETPPPETLGSAKDSGGESREQEAREFANELRASTKASRNPTVWLEGSTGSNQSVNNADTSTVSEAYAKMLTIFISLLVDESSFFAHFMCFEVPGLAPPGGPANGKKSGPNGDDDNDDDLGIMDIDDSDSKSGKRISELGELNDSLRDLLDGIQEDFHVVVDWAYIDPLRCISMHGITERYISGQKADAAGFVRLLLDAFEDRISTQFARFVEEACHQIERNERNVRQMGVLS